MFSQISTFLRTLWGLTIKFRDNHGGFILFMAGFFITAIFQVVSKSLTLANPGTDFGQIISTIGVVMMATNISGFGFLDGLEGKLWHTPSWAPEGTTRKIPTLSGLIFFLVSTALLAWISYSQWEHVSRVFWSYYALLLWGVCVDILIFWELLVAGWYAHLWRFWK